MPPPLPPASPQTTGTGQEQNAPGNRRNRISVLAESDAGRVRCRFQGSKYRTPQIMYLYE
jgi:hypothetical protein